MIRRAFFGIWISLAAAVPAQAQLSLQQVGTGFTQPLFLTAAPGSTNPNEVYVVQKGGLIRSLNTSTQATSTFLDLPNVLGTGQLLTGGEQGLLGMTFSPTYTNGNGHVFVNYVASNGGVTTGGDTRVDRFTVVNGVVQTGSRVNIIQFQQPNQTNHKGGWIGFGQDNSLYIGTGDGGGGNDPLNAGQNLGTYLGKMLRINPSTTTGVGGFTIPTNNPFAGNANPVTQAIFAYGLRNPFRNSFDRLTGNLYIGDVGQDTREEIDFIANGSAGGQNFGWRIMEGTQVNPAFAGSNPPANHVPPIWDQTHASNLVGSITGGYVYRGGNILDNGQNLDGTYIYGDFVTGRIFSFRYNGSLLSDFRDRTAELNSIGIIGGGSLSSFGEDALGRLYAIDFGGQIYRIVGPVPEPSTILMVLAGAAAFGWHRRRRAAMLSKGSA